MTPRRLPLLLALIFAIAGSMLVAPITVNAAHGVAFPSGLDVSSDHDRTATATVGTAHDSIEHLHDVPVAMALAVFAAAAPPQSWSAADRPVLPRGARDRFDRPPRGLP